LRGELPALRGEIEHVDRLVAFGIDQRDFNVASQPRQHRTYLVQQSRMVLGDDFEQRAVCGRRIVEVDVRRNGHLGRSRPPGTLTALQQRLEPSLSAEHILEAFPEARNFTGIQFERAVQIREIKGVQNDARGIRKGIGFVDVHSPAREYPRNR